MDMATASDAPILYTPQGATAPISFPVWWTEDLLPVLARLKAARVDTLKKYLVEMAVEPTKAAYMLQKESLVNDSPADAYFYFRTAEGVDECLLFSLARAGRPEADAKAIVRAMRYDEKRDLVVRVSHIFEPKPPEVPAAATNPNKGLALGDPNQTAPKQPETLGGGAPNPTATVSTS